MLRADQGMVAMYSVVFPNVRGRCGGNNPVFDDGDIASDDGDIKEGLLRRELRW